MQRVKTAFVYVNLYVLSVLLMSIAVPANAAQRVCVITSIANMRSGPGTKYDVLWQVEQYHPLIILKKKGPWYKIRDFEKDTAWIHKSLVGRMKTVITIKNKCNVRSEPDKKGRILFTVEKGVPFKVLKHKGNWIKIEHADGDTGWIYKTLVW